ncbi:MAG: RnfABCDGE type electron transport complex subunit G [Clostridia bacterium]|nr:RnfABCDGE type electron transport complex subunit G [Lachnospiraceae bacterium]NCC00846.1 RnfABCDGE type electron transport complex subunit G [Clostridia bacterium]NCD02076.1 RnfABCDGE type electron transport complex subunit G [Clostridia bacterium]
MKMNPKDIIGPTSVIVGVCLVITAAVVGTNGLTEAKITELNAQTAEEAKKEVLADADSFSTETITTDKGDVEYYVAANGAGYVFSTSNKGYGGQVGVMTGITAEGEIAGVKVVSHNETPGLGAKSEGTDFTDQYKMQIPEGGVLEVTKTGKTADNQIDAISGATITSRAVTSSVNDAIAAYQQITGGAK